jgi:hypothetical protein
VNGDRLKLIHPRVVSHLGLCREVQIPGSHEAMFTAPQRLAQAFIDAGRWSSRRLLATSAFQS